MKPVIAILSVVLLVLLILAGVAFFGPAAKPSEATAEPTVTQPPTTEPTTAPTTESTEPTTESTEPPEPELSREGSVVLEGRDVDLWSHEGECYLRASELAGAAGMTAEGDRLTGLDDILEVLDGQLTVNGKAVGGTLTAQGELYLPYPATVEALQYPTYTDADGVTYITPSARPFELPEGVNVPVLMYHAVSDGIWGVDELFVSPSEMEAQLAYLAENGYDPIWFSDLAHLEDYDKPVILTFDDGYDDNYSELFPLLKRYNTKATVFVIGNAAGTSHKMTEEQIREMSDSGLVSIQSHGYTHGDMDLMDEATLDYELGETKRVITRITGKIPYVLCYPTGRYNDLTLEVAARYYRFGIKMTGKQYNTSDDPLLVNRYYVSRYTGLEEFASFLALSGTK